MKESATPSWLPLEVEGLNFGYSERPLFRDFRACFPKRGFYLLNSAHHINAGIYLLRILMGLSEPVKGEVRAGGVCLTQMAFEEFLPWVREAGYAFESGGLLANRSVRENILLPLAYHQPQQIRAHEAYVDQLLAEYRLTEVQRGLPADLHRGDYKMALLLRSIVHRPKVLFMVDPEEALDPERFGLFASEVRRRFETHELDLVVYTSPLGFKFSPAHQYIVELQQTGSDFQEWAA